MNDCDASFFVYKQQDNEAGNGKKLLVIPPLKRAWLTDSTLL